MNIFEEEEYKVSQEYLTCENESLSGNYTIFEYSDGWLTAYNEDAKVEYYQTQEDYLTKFLKQKQICSTIGACAVSAKP